MLQPSRFEAQVALHGAAMHKAAALLSKVWIFTPFIIRLFP